MFYSITLCLYIICAPVYSFTFVLYTITVLELCMIHNHIGDLYSTLEKYPLALEHYRSYLHMAKCSGSKLNVGESYGLIGSVFASVGE